MRRIERSRPATRAILAVLILISGTPQVAVAKCVYFHVEVRGQVREFGGEPIADAEVMVFVDDDTHAIFDQEIDQEVWRTDSNGRFVAKGAFVAWAWPRWWHRFSSVIDHCGREPASFTIIVQAADFHPKQFVVRSADGAVEEVADGRFVVAPSFPLELLRKRGAA